MQSCINNNLTRAIRPWIHKTQPFEPEGIKNVFFWPCTLFDLLTDEVIEETDIDLMYFLAPYFNTEVQIMEGGRVFAYDGRFLGQEYS